ncbi:hypothetical protein GGP89_003531 [Salinibacter ruber]|uniref:Uncharacterized protein n=1 Tax=Salinibacter ruber TaxID=146919 RepID=A0A9X2ZPV3_9BACT|nr:hypothetical protein [Salinibacter ruber]MCS3860120.1 hypothetical protein [Salinibacter ruber]MCS3866952.1 hypothetical protein [Salinibacter ruber]
MTVHFQGETSPMVVRGVAELAKSHFPGSGDPALQIIKAPSSHEEGSEEGSGRDSGQAFTGGLFNLELNLARPSEIDYLVLQEGEERREAEVEDLFEEWDWQSS